MINDILSDTGDKMKKALEVLTRELASFRTGRASPALVEHVKVEYHGVAIPLNEIATISVPEARLILIQPWDRSAIQSIEKGILKSDLNLNPSSDGNVIRIPIPPLSEERRVELVKLVHKRVEDSRIVVRNLRREGMERLKELERSKSVSKDEQARGLEQLQKLTDSYIEKVNEISRNKESEILKS